ncbi:MAG: 50S ribosomal protein L16 [Candidatus Woesearchaeota archaeon]
MAKLRKFSAYRRLERPYTRKSKYRQKSFVRATPTNKVIRFDMGDTKKTYDAEIILKVNQNIQVRHNALESARQTANRHLESVAGKGNFWLKLRKYPHHVLRENPLASGAGADRMSTGMKKSFGKAIGLAAQLKKGEILFSARVSQKNVAAAKEAMRKIYCKLPCECSIEVISLKEKQAKTVPGEKTESVSQPEPKVKPAGETPETAVVEGPRDTEEPVKTE